MILYINIDTFTGCSFSEAIILLRQLIQNISLKFDKKWQKIKVFENLGATPVETSLKANKGQ